MFQFMMSLSKASNEVVTEMPFGEVILKSALAYLSIFLVVGVIIGAVWLLGKVANKKED